MLWQFFVISLCVNGVTVFSLCINGVTVFSLCVNVVTVFSLCINLVTLAILRHCNSWVVKTISRACELNCTSSCLSCSLVPGTSTKCYMLRLVHNTICCGRKSLHLAICHVEVTYWFTGQIYMTDPSTSSVTRAVFLPLHYRRAT